MFLVYKRHIVAFFLIIHCMMPLQAMDTIKTVYDFASPWLKSAGTLAKPYVTKYALPSLPLIACGGCIAYLKLRLHIMGKEVIALKRVVEARFGQLNAHLDTKFAENNVRLDSLKKELHNVGNQITYLDNTMSEKLRDQSEMIQGQSVILANGLAKVNMRLDLLEEQAHALGIQFDTRTRALQKRMNTRFDKLDKSLEKLQMSVDKRSEVKFNDQYMLCAQREAQKMLAHKKV